MISVEEARELILANGCYSKQELLPLINASGYVLAETILSPIDSPPFNQSAMDGYAFSFSDWGGVDPLNVIGKTPAGENSTFILNPFEAVRVYTGSALPINADVVVMQEKVLLRENTIIISDSQLQSGSNVRIQGSQANKGQILLEKNHLLSPASISLLASVGITKVVVFSKPTISIITTGKELIKAGDPFSPGKIFESNSFGITSALNQINITPLSVLTVDDDEMQIVNVISKQLTSDIVIITGGVSVGDFDFVTSALEKCGVKKIFHGVKQKPGKPLFFGTHNKTRVFALPGNPAAALCCFYEYVLMAISCYTKKDYVKKISLPLTNEFNKKTDLTFFLKGKTNDLGVCILDNQESYLMNSFAIADCIIELENNRALFTTGTPVNLIMIN